MTGAIRDSVKGTGCSYGRTWIHFPTSTWQLRSLSSLIIGLQGADAHETHRQAEYPYQEGKKAAEYHTHI